MWRLTEGPKVVTATKALVSQFKDMEPCPSDRHLRDGLLDIIRKEMDGGKFRTCEWASCYCDETKKQYRVNGKHTSTALAEFNGNMPKIPVIVSKFHCDTLEDVANLYCTFDPRSSARSTTDINRVYQMANPQLAGLSGRVVSLCVTGMAYAMWEREYTRTHKPDERASLMLFHPDFVVWANGILCPAKDGMSAKHLFRSPVVSAMFKTWQKNQKASTEFWELVRDGAGISNKSADRILQRFLLQNAVNSGSGARIAGRKAVDSREMYVKCLHGWNAWRKGESTDLKFYSNVKTPTVI